MRSAKQVSSMLLPMYLRQEPNREQPKQLDVVAYRDRECTDRAGRWLWWNIRKPRKGQATVMFNCYRWKAVWL